MNKVQCPVCKRTDERIQIIYVPLGHGRYSEYLCCECLVRFPFGKNKFGDITDASQIKEVHDVTNAILNNGSNAMPPSEHPDFQPYLNCSKCGKDITTENRKGKNGVWECSLNCK